MRLKFLLVFGLHIMSFKLLAHEEMASKLVTQLSKQETIGSCHLYNPRIEGQNFHMTIADEDQSLDLIVPIHQLKVKGSTIKARFKQVTTGAESLPFGLKSWITLKVKSNANEVVQSVFVKSIDPALVLLGAGIQKFNCQD